MKIWKWLCRSLAAAIVLLPGAVLAQMPKPLEVIVFPGGSNWPIWAAQAKGYFATSGVEVHLTPTPGSAYQLSNTIDGKFDIAITAIDNLIAYDEGQGEATTTKKAELVAVLGSDNGFLHVIAVPEVKSYKELKGKTLSVDALTTGYAFVLQKMLQKGGLKPADYTLVRAGGGLQRFEALMKKEQAATLLFTPFELIAKEKGYHDLGAGIDVFGHYQGLVAAVQRSWAKEHRRELLGFIRGYVVGIDWLHDPRNKGEAIALLRQNITTMAPEIAESTYRVMLDPKHGLLKKGHIDMAGVKTVLALRSEYGEPKKKLADPNRYIDLSYYKQAIAK